MPKVPQAAPCKPEWCLSIILYLPMVPQLPILQHTSPRYPDKAAIEAPLVSLISGLAARIAIHPGHSATLPGIQRPSLPRSRVPCHALALLVTPPHNLTLLLMSLLASSLSRHSLVVYHVLSRLFCGCTDSIRETLGGM